MVVVVGCFFHKGRAYDKFRHKIQDILSVITKTMATEPKYSYIYQNRTSWSRALA